MKILLGSMLRNLATMTPKLGLGKQSTAPILLGNHIAKKTPATVASISSLTYSPKVLPTSMPGLEKTKTVMMAGMATIALNKHRSVNPLGAANLFTSAINPLAPSSHQRLNRNGLCTGDRKPKNENTDAFQQMDEDGDGKLSKAELEKGRLHPAVGDFDFDGDGHISRLEWESSEADGDNWKTERYSGTPIDGEWGLIGAHPGNYPTLQEARQMQIHYYEMSNESLLLLSAMGNGEAACERMIREVMAVDEVHWRVAARTVQEMEQISGGAVAMILRLPYTVGAAAALVAAAVSLPLCFSTPLAFWFNENFVTADIPPPEDLETVLETGSWTWNWMEPPLGAISFLLLCLQFARQQTGHMWKGAGAQGPYNAFMKRRRLNLLLREYPQYSPQIVREFSYTLTARAGNTVSFDALREDPRHRKLKMALKKQKEEGRIVGA